MKTKLVIFWKGFLAGGLGGGIFLWDKTLHELVWIFPIKLLATFFLAAFSGLGSVIARDFYDQYIKQKYLNLISKLKKKDENKN